MAARRAKSFYLLMEMILGDRWLRSERASMQVISTGAAGAANKSRAAEHRIFLS